MLACTSAICLQYQILKERWDFIFDFIINICILCFINLSYALVQNYFVITGFIFTSEHYFLAFVTHFIELI